MEQTIETTAPDRVSQLAEEKMASMQAEKAAKEAEEKAKKDAESKGAATGPQPETQKTKEEIEAQAQQDEEILSAQDEDLDDAQKARKAEILKAKEEKLTVEERLKRTKESMSKRIDELVGEIKAERNQRTQDTERIKFLEQELAKLQESSVPPIKEQVRTLEQDRIAKQIREDAGLPFEERREMTKEDLEAFYVEDQVKFQEWVSERAIRRAEARKEDESTLLGKTSAKNVDRQQRESLAKLTAKYPKLIVNDRAAELVKEGKNEAEIDEILCKENEHYRLMMEIVKENPKFINEPNGPERVMAEMDKRLKGKTYTEEDLKKAKEEGAKLERERLARVDAGAVSGTGKSTPVQLTDMQKEQLDILKKASKFSRYGKSYTPEQFEKTKSITDKERKNWDGKK